MSRSADLSRSTYETKINMSLNLDGSGISNISTGIGFFDHMLTHISKHGFIDLDISCDGDLDVDCHHTVEDVGIVLGKCINLALGDKTGIKRYGYVIIPMDEALVLCSLDLSGRDVFVYEANFTVPTLGMFDTEMVEEFFRAVSSNCGMNLHIKVLRGSNNHHMAEGIFKAFGKALDMAVTVDPRIKGTLSTKGMLE
ncbi:MAG: imidazoleglycerol-phosphate dehydratase HisB [Clostridiales bacterium]|nr:imidazoleglycerol-phosphate dehydratase HisB [Clostridiales bacterium]